MGISFAYPAFLWLLFLIPLFIAIYFLGIFYARKKAINFPNFEALKRVGGYDVFGKNFIELYINIFIILLIIFSLAGTKISYEAQSSSYQYVLGIDNSASMNTDDVSPNRLSSAKESAKNFVDGLSTGTEVAVIEFAGDAKIMQNFDNSKIKTKMSIDLIDFSVIPGADAYNLILVSNTIFGDNSDKALIIISDGQLDIENVQEIVDLANKNKIMIHTIAVGTEEGGDTGLGFISKTDKGMLRTIALGTGGKFFEASDSQSLKDSFEFILNNVSKKVTLDLTIYLLGGVLFLLIFIWILHNFRFRIIP